MAQFLTDPFNIQIPPLEKQYWWPLPRTNSERSEFLTWDRFRQICWYFNTVCREIMQYGFVKRYYLEELVDNHRAFDRMLEEAGLPVRDVAWSVFQHPSNVHEPVNYEMTDEQEAIYREMCGEVHRALGYGWGPPERVRYDD